MRRLEAAAIIVMFLIAGIYGFSISRELQDTSAQLVETQGHVLGVAQDLLYEGSLLLEQADHQNLSSERLGDHLSNIHLTFTWAIAILEGPSVGVDASSLASLKAAGSAVGTLRDLAAYDAINESGVHRELVALGEHTRALAEDARNPGLALPVAQVAEEMESGARDHLLHALDLRSADVHITESLSEVNVSVWADWWPRERCCLWSLDYCFTHGTELLECYRSHANGLADGQVVNATFEAGHASASLPPPPEDADGLTITLRSMIARIPSQDELHLTFEAATQQDPKGDYTNDVDYLQAPG